MKLKKTTTSLFLIAGTCIGAAMIALPAVSAASGYLGTFALLGLAWLMMSYTALLTLEVNLRAPVGANFIRMTTKTLGKWGEGITWMTYLLLLYSLMAAYLTAGTHIVESVLTYFHCSTPDWIHAALWAILPALMIYYGSNTTAVVNRWLTIGLFVCYVLLLSFALPAGDFSWVNSTRFHWHGTFLALTVVVTSFGFHILIPTLREYLQDDLKVLVPVLLKGSSMPLIVYGLWTLAILSTVSASTLTSIADNHLSTTAMIQALVVKTHQPMLSTIGEYFLFFAIATSFIGISLALFDFIADGFCLDKQTVGGKIFTGLITFIPPFIYALCWPNGFVMALQYAGIFVAVLHGILPVCMAALGRQQEPSTYQAPGGSGMLVLAGIFFMTVIISQVIS